MPTRRTWSRRLRTLVDREAWQMEYEDALVDFFRDVKVGHEKIGGLPWTEIDFPEDVAKAERDVLPKAVGTGRDPLTMSMDMNR